MSVLFTAGGVALVTTVAGRVMAHKEKHSMIAPLEIIGYTTLAGMAANTIYQFCVDLSGRFYF